VNFLSCSEPLTKDTVVDISHEALIRQWATLRDWVEDEAHRAAEYRRWRERAESWAAGNSALLTGADLARAIEWRTGSSDDNTKLNWKPTTEWAARYGPTPALEPEDEFARVMSFLDESQQVKARAERRERRVKNWLIALTLCSTLATIGAGGLAYFALDRAIYSTASGYWHPLTFESSLTDTEGNALLKLSRDRTSVRRSFIEQGLGNPDLAKRFYVKPSEIAEAAIGVSPKMRNWTLARMQTIQEKNLNDTIRTARTFITLELADKKSTDLFVTAIKGTTDSDQLEALGQGLAAAAGKLSDTQAQTLAGTLLAAVKGTTDSDELGALGQGLAAAAGKLSDTQVQAFADTLLAAIKETRDFAQFKALGQGLATAIEKPDGKM